MRYELKALYRMHDREESLWVMLYDEELRNTYARSEKYGEMWSYENMACNASDQECQELWLWMTRLTLNAKLRKEWL